MWPDHFYLTELGKIAYGLFACVILLVATIAVRRLLRDRTNLPARLGVTVGLTVVVLVAPLWDVFSISIEAKNLCMEQGGLRVYKTVEADGIRDGGYDLLTKHGFGFVESIGIGGKKYRYSLRDGADSSLKCNGVMTGV